MTAVSYSAVEAAAEYQFGIDAARLGIDHERLGQAWDDAKPAVKHAYRESVRGVVAAAAPVIEAQIATQIKARAIVCPVHHMPDCSPLLNGCSLPKHLHEQRAIDASIARGDS